MSSSQHSWKDFNVQEPQQALESPFPSETVFANEAGEAMEELALSSPEFQLESPFPIEPEAEGFDDLSHEFLVDREIIAADTRSLVRNTLAVPYRWICSLDIYFRDPDERYARKLRHGTGTLISPRHVLTAAHVLQPKGGRVPAAEVIVAPARNGRDNPFGTMRAAKWRASRWWQRSGWKRDYDYALITLKKRISFRKNPALGERPLAFWGSQRMGAGTYLKRLNPKKLNGRTVYIAGYPGDKCGTRPLAGRLCPTGLEASTLWRGRGRLMDVELKERLMRHTVDTFKGQSGAPVWIRYKHRRYMVGIHVAPATYESREDEVLPTSNYAVRITRSLLRQIYAWMRSDYREMD